MMVILYGISILIGRKMDITLGIYLYIKIVFMSPAAGPGWVLVRSTEGFDSMESCQSHLEKEWKPKFNTMVGEEYKGMKILDLEFKCSEEQ